MCIEQKINRIAKNLLAGIEVEFEIVVQGRGNGRVGRDAIKSVTLNGKEIK